MSKGRLYKLFLQGVLSLSSGPVINIGSPKLDADDLDMWHQLLAIVLYVRLCGIS